MENDFLRRTNTHLKAELQKEIQIRTKEAYQDISKCTLPRHTHSTSKSSDDESTHLAISTHSNPLASTTLTLDDALEYRNEPSQLPPSRRSRKQLV